MEADFLFVRIRVCEISPTHPPTQFHVTTSSCCFYRSCFHRSFFVCSLVFLDVFGVCTVFDHVFTCVPSKHLSRAWVCSKGKVACFGDDPGHFPGQVRK